MRTSGRKDQREEPSSRPQGSVSPLVVIVGPTAVGKTALSLHLAEALDGEIISADSRSFYRGMDIGTAKPTKEERARVPHHLIDIADPDETVGLAEYQDLAYATIDDVLVRDKLPLLVGGTGQYVQAVVEGWRIPRVAPHPDLREELETKAERESPYALHDWLKRLDPRAAEDIHPHNVRRVVRALEVCLITGRPISEQQGKDPPPYHILQIGLTMDRDQLYERADRRLEMMIDAGLVDEVRGLLEQGYHWHLPSMSAVGYAEFKSFFGHQQTESTEAETLDDVMEEIRSNLHRFIRHQYNWFSLDDPVIRWFDVTRATHEEIEAFVRTWLNELHWKF
ncbi:MAG: tRNA (adenosine(37)-N6)-dimethylallyltransferase MiaA [Anaerolineae bacterium]|nr:tRNA (adenosine(37)-N6)-dimethylallyltransferase MiaA [Anaerolineae bacterium]